MANTIRLKRSATASAVPSSGSLVTGELAVNTADGKVYLKKDDASVVQISRLTQTVDVQTFDSSGTWTKPAGAVMTTIQLCGGGSGGNAGTGSTGGTAGAAGEPFLITVVSATLNATESVGIGAGGTGGTFDGVNLVSGSFGNTTTFNKFFAMRGGNNTSGQIALKQTNPQASASLYGGGGNASAQGYINPNGSGGGGGGGAVNGSGSTGGSSSSTRPVIYGGAVPAVTGGGAAAGVTGNPGTAGSNGTIDANGFGSGAGGGGGAATGFNNAFGGNGGNGVRGSGGGGAGRSGSTAVGGASGGNGGNGFAIITPVCYT